MGLYKWGIIVSLFLISSSFVEGSSQTRHGTQQSLDTFLCKQANKAVERPRTGVFYNISLPSNFTGMHVSVVRLRTVSFWFRGVNHSVFNLPPKIYPQPNRKRIAILYENLGNFSSHYYHVPNYTLVAPVFGLMAYSSSETTLLDNEKIKFTTQGDPIRIKFPHVGSNAKNKKLPLCAKFSSDGSVELKNMTKPYVCEAKNQGHFTLVVPSPKEVHKKSQRKNFNIWWVFGFVIGFVGLVILALVLLALVKEAKKRRIRKMEKNSEGGEAFDTFWIGGTKLPLASMIRTKPVLENEDTVPH